MFSKQSPRSEETFEYYYNKSKELTSVAGDIDYVRAAEFMRKAYELDPNLACVPLFDLIWNINSPDADCELFKLAFKHSDKNCDMQYRLGKVYREGKGVERDLVLATEWMKKSVMNGNEGANIELFDILWDRGMSEYNNDVFNMVKPLADSGIPEMQERIGRMYWKGIGVGQNLELAAEYMRSASKTGFDWAKAELFDILWDIYTPESTNEMINLALNEIKYHDNREMQVRLGRAYCFGRGVQKNIPYGLKWMQKAVDNGLENVKAEIDSITNELVGTDAIHSDDSDNYDYQVIRDCFSAGYQFPNWCLHKNISRPLFLSKSQNILWEIMIQFHYSKTSIFPDFKLVGEDNEWGMHSFDEVSYSVACTSNGIKFQLFDRSSDRGQYDCIIVLTNEKLGISGFNVITLHTLMNEFITQAYSERPLYNFIINHPGVKIIATNVPEIPLLNTSNLSFDEKWMLENPIEKTRTRIINNLDASSTIHTSLDALGYTNKDYLELTDMPETISNIDGSTSLKDDLRTYQNISNGFRKTLNQPDEYECTLWCVGTCTFIGYCAPWDKTFESHLQKLFNLYQKKIRVVNASQFYAGRYQDVFYNIEHLPVKAGDIIIICLQNLKPTGIPFFDTTHIFERPHNYGEVFTDAWHNNEKGYEILAERFYEFLNSNDYFKKIKYPTPNYGTTHTYGVSTICLNIGHTDVAQPSGIENFIEYLSSIRDSTNGRIGAIVMNCNPFTFGHRYLIETASSEVMRLYVFVVEENKSFFDFEDRIGLVKEGTADLNNVIILPSGQFVLSSRTFSGYFNKEHLQNQIVDSSKDVEIFGRYIAPALGITVRYVGEEPLDKVTRQYNDTMKRILPCFGIEVIEIPRKKDSVGVISASRVRKCLKNGDYSALSQLVPPTTLKFLKNNASKYSTNNRDM